MSRHSVSMSGGAPWGFRLYGGGSDPLVVAKLRRRSKASDAGLVEGDIVLSINQFSTKDMSHPVAMAMVDQASNGLSFEVLRGASDPNAVDAALQSLGGQYQAAPSSAPAPSPQAPAPAPQAPSSLQNGYNPPAPLTNTQQQTQMFNDGNTQRQVTTETTTQKFGGTTLTKVTRQEVTSSSSAGPLAYGAPPSKPKAWAPVGSGVGGGGGGGGLKNPSMQQPRVQAPPGVHVSRNPTDQSITLTLGLGDNKENQRGPSPSSSYIPPSKQSTQQSMFRINKVNTQQPKAIWQPSFIPDLPNRPPPEQTNLMDDMPSFFHPPEPQPEPEPMQEPEPERELPSALRPARDEESTRRPLLEQSEEEYARMMMHMIMHGLEAPDTMYIKKKKVYADSAFFDDPDHKYPTIEEQIKMARKVALSLESPANKKARGHKMFIKRKQKAYRWVAGEGGQEGSFQEVTSADEADEKYYHPDPWKTTGHTWQPPSAPPAPRPIAQPSGPASIPAPPPLSNFNWNKPVYKAPTLPLSGSDKEKEEKSKAMSQDEFERMRMFEQKVQHNKVSPSLSFKIAEDLHGLKGKGAKLFAKRKAKSEAWVVQEKDHIDSGDSRRKDPAFLLKVTGGNMAGRMPMPGMPGLESPPAAPSPSRPRLQEMIAPPKPALTPWDAAARGNIDKAFDHLDDYMKMKRGSEKLDEVAASLSTKRASTATMPDYTRKIQPWDQPGSSDITPRCRTPPNTSSSLAPPPPSSSSSLLSSLLSSAPKLKPWASSSALNQRSSAPAAPAPTAAAPGGFGSSSSSTPGFRPVKFKAPGSGGYQAAPPPQPVMEADGFCDL